MLSVNEKTKTIYLYDVIGQNWFGEGVSSGGVIEALNQFDGERVTVRINSPGGVVDEGIAIYTALREHSGGVDTIVDALAASIASIIALAGESRTTAKGARWMIHRASTIAMGNANDMRKIVDVLEKHDESILSIYEDYLAEDKDAIAKLLDAETWYTADEAIAAGLSTGMTSKSSEKPTPAAWFRNPPKAFFNVTDKQKTDASHRQLHLSKAKLLRLRAGK